MLGIASGTFRNKFSYCRRGNFPHCCCRGYISVLEWWKTCPAHTKSHLQSPLPLQLRGAFRLQNWIRKEEKQRAGVFSVHEQCSSCWLPVQQLQGLRGDAQVCPAHRGAFAGLLLSRSTWEGHPVPLLMAAEGKNPEITGKQELATVTDSPRFSGSSPDVTILQNAEW